MSNDVFVTTLGDVCMDSSGPPHITRGVIMAGTAVVVWEFQRQTTLVTSTCGAALMAQGLPSTWRGANIDMNPCVLAWTASLQGGYNRST